MACARAVLALILGLQASLISAFEIVESDLESRFTYGHGIEDNKSSEASLTLLPRLGASFSNSLWLEASARIRIDAADELEPKEPRYDTYSVASAPWTFNDEGSAELRDFYLNWSIGNSQLRLGKQQIVWGSLDGVKVLDQMNPQSFREFILADFEDSRINLWSAYLDTRIAGWRTELVWTPDTTGHDIPESRAWFEFQAPRFRYGAEPGSPLPEITTDLPTSVIEDATYGLRLSRQFGSFDLRLQAQSGLDYEPLGRVKAASSGVVLEQYYQRREVYGLSFEGALGGIVLRGETAYQPQRDFNTRTEFGLDSNEADQWTAALAMDIDGPWNTFINAQYVYDSVFNESESLVRPSNDHIATVFLRRSFAYDALIAELRWYGTLDEGDGLGRASLSWILTDSITVDLGGDVFWGNDNGLFGQFADRDRVSATVSITF
jgi:hypothetical protein